MLPSLGLTAALLVAVVPAIIPVVAQVEIWDADAIGTLIFVDGTVIDGCEANIQTA